MKVTEAHVKDEIRAYFRRLIHNLRATHQTFSANANLATKLNEKHEQPREELAKGRVPTRRGVAEREVRKAQPKHACLNRKLIETAI